MLLGLRLVEAFSEFSRSETVTFLEFATEVAAVDIAQMRPNLFHCQESLRQHSVCLPHSQFRNIVRHWQGHLVLEEMREPPARHVYRTR